MNAQLKVGSLFSGIGGFDLGLERAGMQTVWFCEQDDFCRRVLAKHWPSVPCHDDVCFLVADAERLPGQLDRFRQTPRRKHDQDLEHADDGAKGDRRGGLVSVRVPYVDVLCGGFPCQDLSYAGKGAGLNGARSGLWAEYARLIGELRPRYVIVENVAALLARGLSRVLGDLAALGYDAEWDCIPASAVGAPHRRDRLWLVAYPNRQGEPHGPVDAQASGHETDAGRRDMGNTDIQGLEGCRRHAECADQRFAGPAGWGESAHWLIEPNMGRVANGIPQRVDRLRSLGNALVPQIAEWIGRRILAYEEMA